jgi:hypothetical protein
VRWLSVVCGCDSFLSALLVCYMRRIWGRGLVAVLNVSGATLWCHTLNSKEMQAVPTSVYPRISSGVVFGCGGGNATVQHLEYG